MTGETAGTHDASAQMKSHAPLVLALEPAGAQIGLADGSEGRIPFAEMKWARRTRDGQTVGGTSIMGLMMLAAGPGCVIQLEAEGPQAPEAIEALVALVEDGFGEEN